MESWLRVIMWTLKRSIHRATYSEVKFTVAGIHTGGRIGLISHRRSSSLNSTFLWVTIILFPCIWHMEAPISGFGLELTLIEEDNLHIGLFWRPMTTMPPSINKVRLQKNITSSEIWFKNMLTESCQQSLNLYQPCKYLLLLLLSLLIFFLTCLKQSYNKF